MIKGQDYIGNGVVVICHDGQGRYLLEFRSDKCRDEHFTWSPVGSGAIEFGDTIEDTVYKEVKEECGADVLGIEFLGTHETFREHDGHNTHWIQFFYKVLINPEQVSIKEPEKCLKLEWFRLEDFPTPMHSRFPFFIEKHKDKL